MRFAEDNDQGRRPAGPVAEGDSPAHPPESSPSTPPAGGRAGGDGAAPSAEEGAAEGSAVTADLERLADAEAKRDEYLELARRAQADFENYRKRMAAEVQAAALRGKAALVGELVHVIDNLERALAAAGEGASEDDPLLQGIRLTHKDLRAALDNHGVEVFDPAGEKFDPAKHEAITTAPAGEGAEVGVVTETLQKGYALNGQLIRPARVVVSA